MKPILILTAAALVLAAGSQAQERTAGQAYDAQINWTAITDRLDMLDTQNKALAALLDKMQACNAKQMIFAPGTTGADASGCIPASLGVAGYVKAGGTFKGVVPKKVAAPSAGQTLCTQAGFRGVIGDFATGEQSCTTGPGDTGPLCSPVYTYACY